MLERAFNEVDAMVEALGGTAATARIVRVGDSTVSNWRRANRIPAERYFVFLEALKRSGQLEPDPSLFGFYDVGC